MVSQHQVSQHIYLDIYLGVLLQHCFNAISRNYLFVVASGKLLENVPI
jgi:hypothetical protein